MQGLQQKQTSEDRIFDIITTALMGVGCFIILYPLYFIVIASFSDPQHVLNGEVILFPKGLNTAGYKRILKYTPLWRGYANSLYYSIVGAALSGFLSLIAAYPLSRRDFSGRKAMTAILLIAMFFSGGLIPQYILVNALKLRNTWWVLLLVGGIQITNIFIASSYFKTTNVESLFEASQIDGCTHFGYFFRILLPISTPILIVMLLFYGVWQWNDFFRALIYLDKQQYYPIQLVLKDLLATNQVTGAMFEMLAEDQEAYAEMLKAADSMKYGIIIFATLPMLLLYLILQKYFVQGITLGSVKE
ncbi:MAG: carbohydrate ABC transporter permease [Spirochaetaceae bacterium]|jgi:putative aldouronate transport system permease protein|nr:carbohydrate ABC transporter permease [Spirochaetaceae bacterium]